MYSLIGNVLPNVLPNTTFFIHNGLGNEVMTFNKVWFLSCLWLIGWNLKSNSSAEQQLGEFRRYGIYSVSNLFSLGLSFCTC